MQNQRPTPEPEPEPATDRELRQARAEIARLRALAERADAVNELAAAINATDDFELIVQIVEQQARQALAFDLCCLALRDQNGRLEFRFVFPINQSFWSVQPGAPVDRLLQRPEPLLLGAAPAAGPARELLELLQLPVELPSLLLTPIASHHGFEGCLLFGAAEPDRYDADDLRIAGQLAAHLAAARERTRFALAFRNEHAAVSTLYESLSELSRVLNAAELSERLLQISVLSTGAERGMVLQLDPETGEPQQAMSWPQPLAPGQNLALLAALGFAPRALTTRQTVLSANAPADPAWLPPTDAERNARSVLCLPIGHRDQVAGILTLTHGDFGVFEAEHVSFMETLARQAAIMLDNVRLYEQQNRLFHQYVTPSFANRLLADPLLSSLGGQRQTVTILFADIKGFTAFAEQHRPEALVTILNTYLGIAADAVLECGGTLDKFMGDAVMAIFNAPAEQPDHALRAARAALRLQHLIAAYHRMTAGEQQLRFRVGLHSGEAVVGNIGTAALRNYTAIGDAVNTAKRIQEAAETGQVLCSAAVARQLAPAATEFVGELALKGKSQPEPVYRLLELDG